MRYIEDPRRIDSLKTELGRRIWAAACNIRRKPESVRRIRLEIARKTSNERKRAHMHERLTKLTQSCSVKRKHKNMGGGGTNHRKTRKRNRN
jgi:hypothetical protein